MALGALVALGSLARADGLLLWVPVGLALLSTDPGRRWPAAGLAFGAFAVMMAPWWARNLAVTGSVLGSGAGRALWLLEYDELFTYPASGLTFDRWWAAGLAAHVQPRLAALWTNLQSVIAVNGYVLLLPLMLIGGWHHRKRLTVRAAAVYAAALYLVMSLVFPFAGARGGLFHSSAAVMPLLYALAASGLEISARWLAPRRGWDPGRTRSLLLTATVALAVMLSLWTVLSKTGLFGKGTSFARNQDTYQTAGELLAAEVDRSSVIAVGDPPGYFLATGSPAVVIPHGDESVLQQAAAEFGIEWIVLEADHPRGLRELYDAPGRRSWLAEPLSYLDPSGRPVYLYRVALEGG
jgi:hypothetical protein